METRRPLDEIEDRDEIRDRNDELTEEKAPPKPKVKPESDTNWIDWLHIAASLAAVIAITLLTFEMAVGDIRLGKIVAYAMGSSLLIGVLFMMVIVYRWALSKIGPGLWRYTFWALTLPFAFIYYIVFVFIIFSRFAPLLVRIMEAAGENAP
ncbi:hypothetical protein ACFL45_06885 [Candidatus Neomarinimicrobiota bacterium]